ncbi:MAG: SET domain-containing protein [Nitrospirae bacterium]|nr:SET domain-containing protein [Nitrospirota bacterium]
MNPKLEIRDTGSYGRGLFTKADIRKGELLSVFGGYVMTRLEEETLPEDFRDAGVMISEELCLGKISRDQIEPADYINHSCSPNAGFKGQIFLVAMQKIRGGGGGG